MSSLHQPVDETTVQNISTSQFGCRLGLMPEPVDPALIRELAAIPVACISDVMMRLAAGGANLRPIGTAELCGTAVTVRTAPGDNLMVHKAIDLARRGDVIVVDASGDLTNAIIGERMAVTAMAKGIAGFVIFGAVRDAAYLRNSGFPVFAAGITHRGPYKHGPGEVNFPIAINGMVVAPGDVIVGDDDGVLALPILDAPTIATAARKKANAERDNPPTSDDKSWIDIALRNLNCEGL